MTSIWEAKCNMSTFTNDGNARMQSVLSEFACLRGAFWEGKGWKIRMLHNQESYCVFKDVCVLLLKEPKVCEMTLYSLFFFKTMPLCAPKFLFFHSQWKYILRFSKVLFSRTHCSRWRLCIIDCSWFLKSTAPYRQTLAALALLTLQNSISCVITQALLIHLTSALRL